MAQENLILTDRQLSALERTKEEKEAHGEIETEHPRYLGGAGHCGLKFELCGEY
jgi:hypothetical protein